MRIHESWIAKDLEGFFRVLVDIVFWPLPYVLSKTTRNLIHVRQWPAWYGRRNFRNSSLIFLKVLALMLFTFRNLPTSVSAACVASGAQAVPLCRQTVCADYCTVLHNADKLLCRLMWACHCTTYGQFQCLVLRIVLMFDSYFSLSGLFLPDFSVTASRTTEHVRGLEL